MIASAYTYPVEVDETLVGGRTKGAGHGVHHKATVVGAVEVRPRPPSAEGKKHKRMVYAGRLPTVCTHLFSEKNQP